MYRVFLMCALAAFLSPLHARGDEVDDLLTQFRALIEKPPRDRTIDDKTELLRLGDRLYLWAKKNPQEERSTQVLLALCQDRPLGAQALGAIRLLLDRHPDLPDFADLCQPIAETTWSDADAILEKIAKTSPHALARGAALWSQAKRGLAAASEIDPLKVEQVAAAQQTALKHLKAVADFKEPLKLGETDLRELAQARRGLLERIALGVRAPEVTGEDLSGAELKLTSYRGKVAALIFWGAWCPICREQFPAEKELAKKYDGKPFVMLGVNSDDERETATKLAAAEGLSWPSYWDEGSTRGPIAQQWGVEFWPTVILLDHRGVIRYRFKGMKGVDEAAAILLKEI